jgi:signal transduction histidine kinase
MMALDKRACVARLNGLEEYRKVVLSMTVSSSDIDMKTADVPAGDILVVDDNAANLLAMESALGVLGCPIVRAQSGEEALRLLLQRDFALILLDVQMPALGGFETAKIIRERKRSRHTPIIFISAYGRDEDHVLDAYKLGAVDFLFKPIIADILVSKAAVFVELHRSAALMAQQSERLRAHERREHERVLEEERRRWNEEALRRQMEELAEADRRKDEFLAVLGHELRNPLSAIVVGSELLMRKLSAIPGLDESILRARERIERQAQYLHRLVDDLLDLARINSGKIELKRSNATLQYIIEQAVTTSLPSIEKAGHKLTVEVPSTPVTMWADPVRLIQAVGNLLSNASRYTDPGGSIVVKCNVRDDEVDIAVGDNGCGISPELLPRVFDIFVQAGPGGVKHGLGLGLTIVKRLVGLHYGTVRAASDGPGKGATFTITLPLRPKTPDEARGRTPPWASPAVVRPEGLSIVLVEDNQDIRESMQELLTELGHSVQAADDGGSGADLILRLSPDVAIVDLGLPVLDGYKLAERVRSQVGPNSVRLIALTGYGQESDRIRAREAGFDAHLVKPADINAVMSVLTPKA